MITADDLYQAIHHAGPAGLAMADVNRLHKVDPARPKILPTERAAAGRHLRLLLDAAAIEEAGKGRWRTVSGPDWTSGDPTPRRATQPVPQARQVLPPDETQPPAPEPPGPDPELAAAIVVDPALLAYADPDERLALGLYLVQHSDDWRTWVPALFPQFASRPFAPHHESFWEQVWQIEAGQPFDPLVEVWPRGHGKALDLDVLLPTPSGWVAMRDIHPGDQVLDEAGRPCTVIAESAIETKPTYRVTFKGGATVDASGDHLWTALDLRSRRVMLGHAGLPEDWAAWSHEDRPQTACEIPECNRHATSRGPDRERWCGAHHNRWKRHGDPLAGGPLRKQRAPDVTPGRQFSATTLTTEEMAKQLKVGAEWNWAIPTAAPFDLPDVDLPIDPWLLGMWLGDGTTHAGAITVGYDDIDAMLPLIEMAWPDVRPLRRPAATCVSLLGFRRRLIDQGLLGNKHVPDAYLRASPKQRAALLAGLCDSDGNAAGQGVEFTNTNERLARAAHELAVSLGWRASIKESRTSLYGRDCGPKWRVRIAAPASEIFHLPRKRDAAQPEPLAWNGRFHYVTAIEPLGPREVKCIRVDSPNSLFLAGRGAVPTHNSTSAEMAVVALAARGRRRYCWYISSTQQLADEHVASIGAMLQTDVMSVAYPNLASRDIDKYGVSKGWRRNRLRTADGFVIDALGLDTAARGMKVEDMRPDLFVLDDVDESDDTPGTIDKKIRAITRKILPAGARHLGVIAVQNLVHPESIFARLVSSGRPGEPDPAPFLSNRQVSGPIPAVYDLDYEHVTDIDGRSRCLITDGTPSWPEGMTLAECQHEIDTFGIEAFLAECQHDEPDLRGGWFDHLDFTDSGPIRIAEALLPRLVRTAVVVDPAVTKTDKSDSCGIVVMSLTADRRFAVQWAWERIASPAEAMRTAITAAIEFGAEALVVETDQGGDTWKTVFETVLKVVVDELIADNGGDTPDGLFLPRFEQAKAGSTGMSKRERIAKLRVDYDVGPRIIHVAGGAHVLERGLRRFPLFKPYDVVDAAWHARNWLATKGRGDMPAGKVRTRAAKGVLPTFSPSQLPGAR